MTVDAIIADILAREGGATYTDTPGDRGGPTKYGITAATLGVWRGLPGPAPAAAVQALDEAEARAIYVRRYVEQPGFLGVADDALRAQLVDIGVNMGTVTAIRMLQGVLGVHQDGEIGPQTRAALTAADPAVVRAGLVQRRADRYLDLALRTPAVRTFLAEHPDEQLKFLRGWIRRALSFT